LGDGGVQRPDDPPAAGRRGARRDGGAARVRGGLPGGRPAAVPPPRPAWRLGRLANRPGGVRERARRSCAMSMPLAGIRVIDWTIWQQGPVASVMLGDLGAEVIKIEERSGGDPGRGVLPAQGLDLTDRPNFYFEANNRNKKSLAVDLKKPEGAAIVRQLAARADVFVQNFRQGV